MRNRFLFLIFLVVLNSCFAETIIENEEVTGSLDVGKSVGYELSTVIDWRYYMFIAKVSQ